MPRIQFIPQPLDFSGDRGQQIVAPIMANAMQLADTFTTEVPRLRMQQDAIAEEKTRYVQARDRDEIRYQTSKRRQADADLRSQYGGTDMLMRPDMLDTDGDGIGDLAGGGAGRGRAGGSMRMPTGRAGAGGMTDYQGEQLDDRDLKSAEDRIQKLIDQEMGIRPTKRQALVDYEVDEAGNEIDPLKAGELPADRKRILKQRPGLAADGTPLMRDRNADEAQSDLEAARLNAYRKFDSGRPLTAAEVTALRRAGYQLAGGEGVGGDPADSTAAPGMRMGGRPAAPRSVYSDMQRMLALQHLDRLATVDPNDRARNGLPNDMQIEQLKMQLSQGQAPAPAAVPEIGLPPDDGFGQMQPVAEAAPVVDAPAVEAAPPADSQQPGLGAMPDIDFDASAQRFIAGAQQLFASLLSQAQQSLNRGDAATYATLQAKAKDVADKLTAAGAPTAMPGMARDRADQSHGADRTWRGETVAQAPTLPVMAAEPEPAWGMGPRGPDAIVDSILRMRSAKPDPALVAQPWRQ